MNRLLAQAICFVYGVVVLISILRWNAITHISDRQANESAQEALMTAFA